MPDQEQQKSFSRSHSFLKDSAYASPLGLYEIDEIFSIGLTNLRQYCRALSLHKWSGRCRAFLPCAGIDSWNKARARDILHSRRLVN
jgi:hypothetical protein